MKRLLLLPLAVVLALAGCTSNKTEQPLSRQMLAAAKTAFAEKPDTESQRRAAEAISREQFIGIGTGPLILVDVESNRQYATLNQISQNGEYAVFMSLDQKSLTFSKGVLSASRGLGDDLMALDMAQTRAALQAARPGTTATRRVHYRLDGEGVMQKAAYDCRLTARGLEDLVSIHKKFRLLRYDETCHQAGQAAISYTNNYWLDPRSKVIWKSRQWVSPRAGYLGIEVLIPEKS